MDLPGWFPEYTGMSLLAGVGSLMRAKQWTDPVTRKVQWSKLVTEGATAIGLGVGVIALGASWHVETPVLCGISVFAGWLGPATVSELVLKKIGVKP